MVPAAACREEEGQRLTAEEIKPGTWQGPCLHSGAGGHGAGAFGATMARAKCPAPIAPKHALRCVRAGRRRALSVLTHSRPPDHQHYTATA